MEGLETMRFYEISFFVDSLEDCPEFLPNANLTEHPWVCIRSKEYPALVSFHFPKASVLECLKHLRDSLTKLIESNEVEPDLLKGYPE